MIAYNEIRKVHLEVSTKCNAMCPLCPRNFHGYQFNDGYLETNMTLDQAKHIFDRAFVEQLTSVWISGNFGDIIMNPDGGSIVEYFRSCNPNLEIGISTNGSGRTPDFWKRLAAAGAIVDFCLDGLSDTHSLYRQNTSWEKIIDNARIFIKAGGNAAWRFIKFAHNMHQIEQCKAMAQELGFSSFKAITSNRNSGPVFNKKGELKHVIGNYAGPTEFKGLFHRKITDMVLLEDIVPERTPKSDIKCQSVKDNAIYVAANGDVSPCCWTGFYPTTYGHGEYHQAVNAQIAPLINNNNSLETTLRDCILWFSSIEETWKIAEYENGRLVACDDNCGININIDNPE